MVSPIRAGSFDPTGFDANDTVFGTDRLLAQATTTTPPMRMQSPLIPSIATDPNNPARLRPQAGVVNIDVEPTLEHGARTSTHAIVLHMTGGSAAGTLANYHHSSVGAHFLVARDGTITQTADMDQVAYHVGNPRPKGYLPTANGGNQRVDADLTPASQAVLNQIAQGRIGFGAGVRQLAAIENAKPYGNDRNDETTRGPVNADSIGIEFEAGLQPDGTYENLTDAQKASGLALLNLLEAQYGLSSADVYEHPDVSYKTYSEARGAKQQIEYYSGP